MIESRNKVHDLTKLGAGLVARTNVPIHRRALRHRLMTNISSFPHEHLLGLINDNCPDLIALLDANGSIIYGNTAHLVRLGRDTQSLIGGTVLELIHPDDAPKFEEAIRASAKRRTGFQVNARWVRDSRRAVEFHSIGKWIPADGGRSNYLLLCSREMGPSLDVGETVDHGALSPEIRLETLQLLVRAEGEKNLVARAIHDDLGQKLTALTLELSLWKSELDSGQSRSVNAIREKIAVLTGLAHGMITFTRKVTATLRPRVLEEFGLVAALEWHVEKVQKQTGMACTFSTESERLEIEVFLASQLFRVVEEVIQLRLRAACKFLHLRLLARDGMVVLIFEDAGPERQLTSEITARVRLLGGEIEVNAQDNSIVIALPLNASSGLLNQAVL